MSLILSIKNDIIHSQRCQVFSQRHFPKGDFSNDNFPSGNFPIVQFTKRHFPKGQIRPSEAPQAALGPSAAARTDLGSCRFENCKFGKLPFEKIPLVSCRLRKIIKESTLHLHRTSLFIFTSFFAGQKKQDKKNWHDL